MVAGVSFSLSSMALMMALMRMVNVICGQEVQYLYGNNHYPVKEYTGDTNDYKSIFEASRRPRIVEFYSPHCVSIVNKTIIRACYVQKKGHKISRFGITS